MEESNLDRRGMSTFPRSVAASKAEQASGEDSGLSTEIIETGDVVDNLRHLLPLVCVSDGKYSTSKRVRYLNDLAKVIKQADHVIEPAYPVERIIECARLSLLSNVKEVRAGGLRVLRYLLTSQEAFIVMRKHCIDLLVVRSLDAPPSREIERLQAVRFVRQAMSLCPKVISRSLMAPLVSIVLSTVEPQDNLTWSCMATLCELALNNPELAARTGAIKALVRGLLKCCTSRISESVILTLSHLLNCPSSRKYVSSQFDIESVLAPITDLHYCHQPAEGGTRGGERQNSNTRVEASKMALVSLLKCWPGIFCLCNQHNLGMTSLLNMLPLAKPNVQREILDVLYGVFQLEVPEWSKSYNDALASIDPAKAKNEWSLMEGFVAEEGNDLLPPKSVDRTNLIDCYQALLLAALMEEGLFHVLVETVRTAERRVTIMATILMAELLHLTNILLPPGYSSDAHCLPDLISSALDFHDRQDQRNRASEVISCLDRIHQLKKEGVKPSSLFLKLILDQSGYFVKKKEEFHHIQSELDEAAIANLIKDTMVLVTKDYLKWDWNLLFSFLQHPSLKTTQTNEDALFSRFIKRLCNFYKPSNHLYSTINYNEANSKRYSAVGQKLVKYLCRAEEGNTRYLFDLVTDMVKELGQVTASKLTADVFSNTSISHKMARDYFLFLGTISFHKPSLLEQCKAYGPLLDICNYHNRSDLMKLIVSTLDFAHDVHAQVILGKILTSTDKEMRLYATKHLRVLLRAKMPFYNSWGLELLIPQLYDTDKEVAIEAADILDEACDEESFLKALVLQQPQLLHLGEKGASIQTRFFSVKRGFALMARLGYLDWLQQKWKESYNKLYVYIVEEKLAESLTSFKHVQDHEFIRRTNTNVINPKAFVPVHLYGQLAQQVEGCALLEKENYVPQFAKVISACADSICSHDDITEFKAAIWALGHIGSAVGGLELLVKEGVIEIMVSLAESCPVLSIRGTAYYAVCLISKTSRGAEVLLELNWTTVCHSLAEKWPLACQEVPSSMDAVFTPPVMSPQKGGTLGRHAGSTKSMGYLVSSPPTPSWAETMLPSCKPESPKKRTCQSVSNITDKESPKLVKYHSSNVFDDSSPGQRFRAVSSSKKQKQSVHRSRTTATGRPLAAGVKRPTSIMGGDTSSIHSRSFSGVSQSFSFGFRQSASGLSTPYLGVCLPLDIMKMFEYDEPKYKGFVTDAIGAPDFKKDTIPHNPYKCLHCSLSLNKSHHRSQSDLSVSNENLAYSHYLSATGSMGSPSPVLRSRSHTSESMGSSSCSSGRSKSPPPKRDGKIVLVEEAKPAGVVDGTGPKVKAVKEEEALSNEKKSRSPLVRMKRVISEGSEGFGRTTSSSGEGPSGQSTSGEGQSTSGEGPSTSGEGPSSFASSKVTPTSSGSKSTNSSPGSGSGSKLLTSTTTNSGILPNKMQPSSPKVQSPLTSTSQSKVQCLPTSSERKVETASANGGSNVHDSSDSYPASPTRGDIKTNTPHSSDPNKPASPTSTDHREPISPTSKRRHKSGNEVKENEEGKGNGDVGDLRGEEEMVEESVESKGAQEVMINVIGASAATLRDQKLKLKQAVRRDSGGHVSETGSSSSIGAASTTDKQHHAFLEVVFGLSSDVSLKKNSMTLNGFSQKYPHLSQDMCLYSKVIDFLSTYQYNLSTRRFIQSKFDKLNFSALYAARPQLDEEFSEDDFLSSACSSRRGSFSSMDTDNFSLGSGHRRRSSTSDATKFKERLQMLSHSVDIQENQMTESPQEEEAASSVPSETGVRTVDDVSAIHLPLIAGAGVVAQGGNESGLPVKGARGDESKSRAWSCDEPGVLKVTPAKAAAASVATETDKDKEASSTGASVVNIGFDL